MSPGLFSRVTANLTSSPNPSHPKPPPHAYHPSQPNPSPAYPQPASQPDGQFEYGAKKAFVSGNMYNDSNAPNQPPPPHASFSSSAGSSSSSMSSSLSPANHPSERTLSAALRGDYPNDPSPSASSNNIPALGAPTTGSTYRDHDDTRMSVDAQPSSHPYAAQSNQYSSQPQGGQPHQQQQQQQQPPYPMAASSSTAPPVPYGGSGAAPAVQLAAEQLSAAQAALRQAEEQTRVAKMNAAVAQAKESGQQAQPPAAAQVKIRKTAGKYALKDFQIERTLGTGSFGRVHLVKSRHNARFYAVKVLGKEKVVRMKQVEHTNSEREMLVRVRHPFLVNLWGTFCDSKNLYMVMDFVAGGELFSLLRKSQRFPNSVAKFYAAEVALALDYLHSLDIIYRDLKPENILLGADGHVKVTDFGFAKHVPDVTWTLCGTPDYLAPEVVQSKAYNKSVDWYALGVLIFEMLAGYPPFFTEDGNPMKLYEKIIAGKVRYPNYFEALSKDLLKSLLTSDLTKRFGNLKSGSHDIFGHEWFSEVDWDRLYRRDIPAPYIPKIEGDGDSSQFDRYAECDTSEYGQGGPDPHGGLFPDF